MTKTEKILLFTASLFFLAALFLLPGPEGAREAGSAYALPGPTIPPQEGDALWITLAQRVDLNHADADALTVLPGVGPTLAEAIVAYREEHGPFQSAAELLYVKGFGQAALDALYAATGGDGG